MTDEQFDFEEKLYEEKSRDDFLKTRLNSLASVCETIRSAVGAECVINKEVEVIHNLDLFAPDMLEILILVIANHLKSTPTSLDSSPELRPYFSLVDNILSNKEWSGKELSEIIYENTRNIVSQMYFGYENRVVRDDSINTLSPKEYLIKVFEGDTLIKTLSEADYQRIWGPDAYEGYSLQEKIIRLAEHEICKIVNKNRQIFVEWENKEKKQKGYLLPDHKLSIEPTAWVYTPEYSWIRRITKLGWGYSTKFVLNNSGERVIEPTKEPKYIGTIKFLNDAIANDIEYHDILLNNKPHTVSWFRIGHKGRLISISDKGKDGDDIADLLKTNREGFPDRVIKDLGWAKMWWKDRVDLLVLGFADEE